MSDFSIGNGKNTKLINLKGFKGGIERKNIKSQKELVIFDKADKNKDGVLSNEEMQDFVKDIQSYADKKDVDNLSNKEAKRFLKGNDLKEIKKEDLFKFLENVSVSSENISSCAIDEAKNQVIIEYEDGTTKTIDKNDNTYTEEKPGEQGTGQTHINKYNDKDTLLEEKVLESNEKDYTSNEYEVDENGQAVVNENGKPVFKKQTTVTNDGKNTDTKIYENGKPVSETVSKNNGAVVTEITYEDGNPKSAVETQGEYTVKNFEYVDGNPRETKRVENKGLDTEKVTEFKYNEDGTVTEDISELGGAKTTTRTKKDDVVIYEKIVEGTKTTERKLQEDGNTLETIQDGSTTTTNSINADGHRLSQKKVVDGQEYSLEYDGEGNTKGVIVQNGESIEAIAKKFNVSVDKLKEVNADKLKGSKTKYFSVGEEIKIPREMEADEKALQGRKSAEEAKADYARDAEIRRQKAEEIQARKAQEEATLKELGLIKRENGEVEGHYKKNPNKKIKFKKIGIAKYGRSICQDKNGNYVVVTQDGTILSMDYAKNTKKYQDNIRYNQNLKIRKGAEGLAQQFYQIADDNSGIVSIRKMQQLLDTKVNEKNITAFLDAYDKYKHRDSSIIDTVTSEVGASGNHAQKQVLDTIMRNLSNAARKAGVSESDIKKANADFQKAYNVEYRSLEGAARRTNPKDMEKAMDFLRGAIASKQNGGGNISEKEAISQFNQSFASENKTAQKDYKDARAAEGWTAKVGDKVCGWFGCTTIADMDKKLGANAAAVKKLAASKTEAEFKANYKAVFGIEFDKNKIAARQTALERYQLASNCNSTIKLTNTILKSSNSYSGLRQSLKTNFKYDDATINQIIDSYAAQTGKTNPTDDEKRVLLVQFLQDTKSEAAQNYRAASQGKTLEQMGKDIDLITRSAFGTSDIVKDVIQFNENQQTTEMVTEAAFEIAGTVALQFVPGLGQAAAAKLAVSAARWGTKAVKVVKYAQKAEKAFNTVNKFQKGQAISNATTRTAKVANKGVQVGMQMSHAGTATMAVDLSDGKSVKEATKKALMNMSFAGVGASSSIIAPKLVQTFGISNKLATEIAEELMNAAGSYGVTTLSGGEYGSTDAFVDFASGLIMSRISHVKSGDVPTQKKPSTLDIATAGGTKAPGGKFKDQFNKVKEEVKAELPDAAPERAAQIYTEGDKLQIQSRTQGKEIEHMVQDEVGFVEVGKERIDIATADADALAKAKKAVESWDSTSRDKAGMLDKIKAREIELDAGKVSNPKTPARSTEVVDRINTNVEQTAENILSGKKGALAPHDAATLEDHLVNNLHTKEEIEQFKSQLRERVGVDDQGSMFKYEVQGKDHAADLIAKADKKLKQLADFDEVLNSIPEQGGIGDMTSLKSFMNKPTTTVDQLETLIAKMEANPAIRKYSGGKRLISDMKAQVDVLKAKKAAAQTSVPKKVDAQVDQKKVDSNVDSRTNIEPKYRRTSDEFIPDELVRNVGNGGKPINENYIQASKDLRQHYNDAIANGTYADSYENYVKTITAGHKVAYAGFDGTHTWYDNVGEGSLDVNPGEIRTKGKLVSDRGDVSKWVEQNIAKKYSDKYSTKEIGQIELEGIPADALPYNAGINHHYPDGKYMPAYFEQMQRTSKEALDLIEKGAPQNEILAKLAEHYQYAANARPFGQINNSLFMNELNTLLQKAGMKPMPHGMLDHVAQRLQPESFKKYFIDEYKRTALDAPTTTPKKVDVQSDQKKVASDNAVSDTASPSNVNHAQGAKVAAEIKSFINNIKDVEFPAELRNVWSGCKKRLSDLTDNLTSQNINISTEQLANSARSILQDLKRISSKVTGSLKTKIDNLIAKVQTMYQKYGINKKLKALDEVMDDVQDMKDNYDLGVDIVEVIKDPTNKDAWYDIADNLQDRMSQGNDLLAEQRIVENMGSDFQKIVDDPTNFENYFDYIGDLRDAGKHHYHNARNYARSQDLDFGHNRSNDDVLDYGQLSNDDVLDYGHNRLIDDVDDNVNTDEDIWFGNSGDDNSGYDLDFGDLG
ncbi:MAG: LysM peptidoglycan-binding domain-containing protein [Candidatus Gastranaerophilaceae bacterium]